MSVDLGISNPMIGGKDLRLQLVESSLDNFLRLYHDISISRIICITRPRLEGFTRF